MKVSVMNGNAMSNSTERVMDNGMEGMNMIRTGNYKHYGQLQDQAEGLTDVVEYVWRNGEIVPANQAEDSTVPIMHSTDDPNFA